MNDYTLESFINFCDDMKIVNESLIISEKDIYHNKENFDSNSINLCFIIGHSGSGKSTMANSMESSKVEKYELDDVIQNYRFTDDNLKEYGDLLNSFFRGPGKGYRFHSQNEIEDRIKELDSKNNGNEDKTDDELWGGITRSFVKYAIQYANSHKKTKFVIEGIWIVNYMKPSDFNDYAFYIKGTSLLTSRWRAAKRDSGNAATKKEQNKARIKNITNFRLMKANYNFEKRLNIFRSYFKSR